MLQFLTEETRIEGRYLGLELYITALGTFFGIKIMLKLGINS
jgi:hypothetical protein